MSDAAGSETYGEGQDHEADFEVLRYTTDLDVQRGRLLDQAANFIADPTGRQQEVFQELCEDWFENLESYLLFLNECTSLELLDRNVVEVLAAQYLLEDAALNDTFFALTGKDELFYRQDGLVTDIAQGLIFQGDEDLEREISVQLIVESILGSLASDVVNFEEFVLALGRADDSKLDREPDEDEAAPTWRRTWLKAAVDVGKIAAGVYIGIKASQYRHQA
jgi:hypothetical protein